MNIFISGEYPSHLTKVYIKIKCIFYLPITSSSFLAIAIKKGCQINFTLCMHTIGNGKLQNHTDTLKDYNQKMKKELEKPISSTNKAKKRKIRKHFM
jgi:hypothetical protein